MNLVILLPFVLIGVATGIYVDPEIPRRIESTGTATLIISFAGSRPDQVRRAVDVEKFSSRNSRIQALYDALLEHCTQTQAEVRHLLHQRIPNGTFDIRHLWISNQMIIRDATEEVIQVLVHSNATSAIHSDKVIPLTKLASDINPKKYNDTLVTISWGINKIDAPSLWAKGIRGQGIVVANIDTGVRRTHEALRKNYRDDYGWYDPYDKTSTPCDYNGHGTHTMGTLAGQTHGIGVAPETKWIACKGCKNTGCSISALLECGQWIACPTKTNGENSNCSKAPNVVSNSWGAGMPGSYDWFHPVLKVWRSMGIVSVFAIGNFGGTCESTGYPGNTPLTIGVGSMTRTDQRSAFSSVGPAPDGSTKPDIAAPGEDIVSAHYLTDTEYKKNSGTSMACPHVAGIAALLLSAAPHLSVHQVEYLIKAGGVAITSTDTKCGGIPDRNYPNNHVGHGRINASLVLRVAVRSSKGFFNNI